MAFVVSLKSSVVPVFPLSYVVQTPVSFAPTALAISPAGTIVAVGGDDGKVHVYLLSVDGSLAVIGESRAAGKWFALFLQWAQCVCRQIAHGPILAL